MSTVTLKDDFSTFYSFLPQSSNFLEAVSYFSSQVNDTESGRKAISRICRLEDRAQRPCHGYITRYRQRLLETDDTGRIQGSPLDCLRKDMAEAFSEIISKEISQG